MEFLLVWFSKSALLPVRGLAASNENLFAPAGNAFVTFPVLPAEQPPRPASAKPEARHVGCFLTAVGVPRFDPRPEGKGAGVQNAGVRASVGRRCTGRCLVLDCVGAVWGSPSLKPRDGSIGFGLNEDMEIALDFTVKITSGTRFPDRHGKLWLDLKCYVKMILLALRICDG